MQLVISHDFAPLQAHLQALYARLNHDLTPLMENIGMALESSTRARFETETAPDGTPWQPLKESTINNKLVAKNGKTNARGGILSDRGDLRRSITLPPAKVWRLAPTAITASITSSVPTPTPLNHAPPKHCLS